MEFERCLDCPGGEATDPESKQTPILIAMEAGIYDPCMLAAMAHVKASNIANALRDEVEVLFGPPKEKASSPDALSEGDAPST